MAALLCLSLSESPSTVFQTLGNLAAILHPMEAGCHKEASSHLTLLNLISENGGNVDKYMSALSGSNGLKDMDLRLHHRLVD